MVATKVEDAPRRERGITFVDWGVRALLAGAKTSTMRVINFGRHDGIPRTGITHDAGNEACSVASWRHTQRKGGGVMEDRQPPVPADREWIELQAEAEGLEARVKELEADLAVAYMLDRALKSERKELGVELSTTNMLYEALESERADQLAGIERRDAQIAALVEASGAALARMEYQAEDAKEMGQGMTDDFVVEMTDEFVAEMRALRKAVEEATP